MEENLKKKIKEIIKKNKETIDEISLELGEKKIIVQELLNELVSKGDILKTPVTLTDGVKVIYYSILK